MSAIQHRVSESADAPSGCQGPEVDVAAASIVLPAVHLIGRATGARFREQPSHEESPIVVFTSSVPTREGGRLELTYPQAAGGPNRVLAERVTFSGDPAVPWPFRGRSLITNMPSGTVALTVESGEAVLAELAAGPVWTLRREDGRSIFRSGLPLPSLPAESGFAASFNGEDFLSLLPLISFLRASQGTKAYRFAPLRASFIIDDPNLHWPRYGFIDYAELAARAERENYHLAFATIPLDSWFTHKGTAELFRRFPTRLSLLVHGNNHAKAELARDYAPATRKALLAQAIRRIEKLEVKAHVPVSRVMVPPHGACSAEMLADIPDVGFEAACISTDSLRSHNPGRPWSRIIGYHPAEVVEGCCVVPRWGLTGNVENAMLLAAYLGKGLILRGHHQDFKKGPEAFEQYARFINGLGDVRWLDMGAMSRSSYLWRQHGSAFRVAPLSPAVTPELPRDASELIVDDVTERADTRWRLMSQGSSRTLQRGEAVSLRGAPSVDLRLQRSPTAKDLGSAVDNSARSVHLVARRLLTEARDRFLSF